LQSQKRDGSCEGKERQEKRAQDLFWKEKEKGERGRGAPLGRPCWLLLP